MVTEEQPKGPRFTNDPNVIFYVMRCDPDFRDWVIIEEWGDRMRVFLRTKGGGKQEVAGLQLDEEGKIYDEKK